MEPVRQYNRDSAESCEQELAYNAEEARRYPYFFRLQILFDAFS